MNTNQVARIAALVGEPARTGMLVALLDGRALTAHELAAAGNVTPATASRHLALLVEADLLRVENHGRHRYHRLESADVARLLEGIMQLAARSAPTSRRVATGPREEAMRLARTCYDHLGGRLAVAIAERLVQDGAVLLEEDTAVVTEHAGVVLEGLGLRSEVVYAQGSGKRPPCRPCLDWGERRVHLAGRLGSMLCSHCLQMGWLLQQADSRALRITPQGAVVFRDWLGNERWSRLAG
jgi:DNA-binding transcriptional ArsR family regulator